MTDIVILLDFCGGGFSLINQRSFHATAVTDRRTLSPGPAHNADAARPMVWELAPAHCAKNFFIQHIQNCYQELTSRPKSKAFAQQINANYNVVYAKPQIALTGISRVLSVSTSLCR